MEYKYLLSMKLGCDYEIDKVRMSPSGVLNSHPLNIFGSFAEAQRELRQLSTRGNLHCHSLYKEHIWACVSTEENTFGRVIYKLYYITKVKNGGPIELDGRIMTSTVPELQIRTDKECRKLAKDEKQQERSLFERLLEELETQRCDKESEFIQSVRDGKGPEELDALKHRIELIRDAMNIIVEYQLDHLYWKA